MRDGIVRSSHSLTLFDVILCMTLAQRIHDTDAAIKAVAYRCRDRVQASLRPQVTRLMKAPDVKAVLAEILKEID